MKHHRARVGQEALHDEPLARAEAHDVVGRCCGAFQPLKSFIRRADGALRGRHRGSLGALPRRAAKAKQLPKPGQVPAGVA